MNSTDLLRQARQAARQGHTDEARGLFEAVLCQDPTDAQALLSLIYLAENGQASLAYLARLLRAHPQHPQARVALHWTRRRIPTSALASPRPGRGSPSVARRSRRLTLRLALVALLIALLGVLGIAWGAGRSPLEMGQADLSPAALQSRTPSPTTLSQVEVVKISIPLFTSTPAPAATATALPGSAWVPVLGQLQTRNLSCESRSATDLARYWGVSVGELAFLEALGRSDNPHKGFVGDVDMPPGSLPPYGYGVYAEPVATTLRDYGLNARSVYNLGMEGLRAELLAGRPVLVWGTYQMASYEPVEWVSRDGQSSTVVPFMHTFLVTGFDGEGVFVLDAYDASVQYYLDDAFLKVWNVFDQMAVVVTGRLP
ncbi:MAG: C39 family peptidase [Anaerolineae bacterium]